MGTIPIVVVQVLALFLGTTIMAGQDRRNARSVSDTCSPVLARNGNSFFTFGVMGDDNQPQAHVQVFLNLVEFGMNVHEV